MTVFQCQAKIIIASNVVQSNRMVSTTGMEVPTRFWPPAGIGESGPGFGAASPGMALARGPDGGEAVVVVGGEEDLLALRHTVEARGEKGQVKSMKAIIRVEWSK